MLALAAFVLFAVGAQPALAARQHCPPNEVALIKALKQRGAIPRNASKAQARSILQRYLQQKLGAQPEDRANLGNGSVAGRSSGVSPWGRVMLAAPAGQVHDNALVILFDFSPADYTDPGFPDQTFQGGPLHGLIPPPGPTDNSTFWPGPGNKGFGVAHYKNMLFGTSFKVYKANGALRGISTDTMRNFYLAESKGKYLLSGAVAGRYTLPYPEAWYGRDAPDGSTDSLTGPVWRVARDAVQALADAQPNFDWSKYDKKNPFGIAGDNPNVPDGIIDHLIVIHAGADQSAGGGAQGDDAIWAHSWWIDSSSGAGPGGKGGFQVPGTVDATHPDGIWAGPYTCNPEDGADGVFCHEFGHDLGLPDEYDTSYGGEAPSAFWTLMAQGSWLGKKFGIGTVAGPLNVWDRTFLGWLKPTEVKVGTAKTLKLAPSATGAFNKVAFQVDLPDAYHEVDLGGTADAPELWSGMGNDLDNLLTAKSAVAVPDDTTVALTFDSWYEIEQGYDFGFVEVSTDAGASWTALAGTSTVDAGNGRPGLSGISNPDGDGAPQWEQESYDMSAYKGQDVLLRFHYKTDGGYALRGWEIDNIALGGFSNAGDISAFDNAPAATQWYLGWKQIDDFWSGATARYYYGEFRNHAGVDAATKTCYNFNDFNYLHVEFYPYNTGLHLIYNDTFFFDNNVGQHPGEGAQMVVDAHPYPDFRVAWDEFSNPILYPWATRVQVRDAAFSTKASPGVWLTPFRGTPEQVLLAGRRAQPVFDDNGMGGYWFGSAWDAGTFIEPLGVHIVVKGFDKAGNMIVSVKGADAIE
jgi:immune inhibitor A